MLVWLVVRTTDSGRVCIMAEENRRLLRPVKASLVMCIALEIFPVHADLVFGAMATHCQTCMLVIILGCNLPTLAPFVYLLLYRDKFGAPWTWNLRTRRTCIFLCILHGYYLVTDAIVFAGMMINP
jgi:hypothetical protein